MTSGDDLPLKKARPLRDVVLRALVSLNALPGHQPCSAMQVAQEIAATGMGGRGYDPVRKCLNRLAEAGRVEKVRLKGWKNGYRLAE